MSFEDQIGTTQCVQHVSNIMLDSKYIESTLCYVPSIFPYVRPFSSIPTHNEHESHHYNDMRQLLYAMNALWCWSFKPVVGCFSSSSPYQRVFHWPCIGATCFPPTIFTLFTTLMCSLITRSASAQCT